jgi:MacB-like periplasmic core domain
LRPLPFPEPAQLVMVALKAPETSDARPFTLREYLDVAPQAAGFASLAAYTFLPVSVSADGVARMVEGQVVSHNYFELLQVTPLAGRFFDAAADSAVGTPHVVISERFG